jgi:hypothetical protein
MRGSNRMTLFEKPHGRRAMAAMSLLAALLSVAAAATAFAGDDPAPAGNGPAGAPSAVAQPAPAAPNATFPTQPPPIQKRGFLNDFGHWWDDSLADFNAKMHGARGTLEDFGKKSTDVAKDAAAATKDAVKHAAEATQGAATAIVRLPNTRVLEMREHCPKAPNGAPDCRIAATNVCRAKGFTSGQPVDVRSSEECPPAALLSEQSPAECPVETVVLRAICQ